MNFRTILPILLTLFSTRSSRSDIDCVDKKTTCNDDSTCCLMLSGTYGCCPMRRAVCCSDKIHCCPEGTSCNLKLMQCDKAPPGISVPIVAKISAKNKKQRNVQCMDHKTYCPPSTTCCPSTTPGHMTCCPTENAVCCSDRKHCCPSGSVCDESTGACATPDNNTVVSNSMMVVFVPWAKKVPALVVDDLELNKTVKCADGKSKCPVGNTCCKMRTGGWGCCPKPKAVCCTDGIHCCPEHTTCDVQKGQCIKQTNIIFGTKYLRLSAAENAVQKMITCADGKSKCSVGDTCCKMGTGKWGCCPKPNAVCCTDGIHCCPEHSICDLEQSRCIQQRVSRPAESDVLQPLLPLAKNSIQWKTCDTKLKVKCPDTSTCCKLTTGKWGCCPMPQATCCSDGVHCCPHGTECDVSHERCTHNDVRRYFTSRSLGQSVGDAFKMKPIVSAVQNLTIGADPKLCPDHIQQCSQGETCCLNKQNSTWSCCPFPEAVCCPDPQQPYCCPKGQKCGPPRPASFGQATCVQYDLR